MQGWELFQLNIEKHIKKNELLLGVRKYYNHQHRNFRPVSFLRAKQIIGLKLWKKLKRIRNTYSSYYAGVYNNNSTII
jgi:hypothetical protein